MARGGDRPVCARSPLATASIDPSIRHGGCK